MDEEDVQLTVHFQSIPQGTFSSLNLQGLCYQRPNQFDTLAQHSYPIQITQDQLQLSKSQTLSRCTDFTGINYSSSQASSHSKMRKKGSKLKKKVKKEEQGNEDKEIHMPKSDRIQIGERPIIINCQSNGPQMIFHKPKSYHQQDQYYMDQQEPWQTNQQFSFQLFSYLLEIPSRKKPRMLSSQYKSIQHYSSSFIKCFLQEVFVQVGVQLQQALRRKVFLNGVRLLVTKYDGKTKFTANYNEQNYDYRLKFKKFVGILIEQPYLPQKLVREDYAICYVEYKSEPKQVIKDIDGQCQEQVKLETEPNYCDPQKYPHPVLTLQGNIHTSPRNDISIHYYDYIKRQIKIFASQLEQSQQNDNLFKIHLNRGTKNYNYLDIEVKPSDMALFSLQKPLYLIQLFQLTSPIRQFNALKDVHLSQVSKQLIKPYLNKEGEFVDLFLSGLNKPQEVAVRKSIGIKNGFGLIQGPPGTGKTTTIVKIVEQEIKRLQKIYIQQLKKEEKQAQRKKQNEEKQNDIELLKQQSLIKQSLIKQSLIKQQVEQQQKKPVSKVAVCAVSNAATDNIALKLIDNQQLQSKVLRIGRCDLSKCKLLSHHLKTIVEEKMFQKLEYNFLGWKQLENKSYHEQLQIVMDLIPKTQYKDQTILSSILLFLLNRLEIEILKCEELKMYEEKNILMNKYYLLADTQLRNRVFAIKQYQLKNQLTSQIINTYPIIVGTANSFGSQEIKKIAHSVTLLLIDQAAQSTQPELLVPIVSTLSPRVILVGDHKQLEPTVFNQYVANLNYSKSMFERLIDNKVEAHMLEIQYRMQKQICRFPSAQFYDGRLRTGTTERVPESLLNLYEKRCLFINVEGHERLISNSYINEWQAKVVIQQLKKLWPYKISIGVISPYKAQVRLLTSMLNKIISQQQQDKTTINTVDSFQGQERDVMLITAVRSNQEGRIGFLKNERRLNVSITRSKMQLVIIGNRNTLIHDPLWNRLIHSIS